jgi:trans-aconitate 2-methyltransferase
MIERARTLRETLAPALRQRVDFQLSDFRNFNADRAYTVVFSNAALQWIGGHRGILAASYRALGDNGRLMVQMPANEDEPAQATMRRMAADPAWCKSLDGVSTPSAENVLPADDYRRILGELGFVDVECFYHTFQHPMSNPGEVVEFCRATSLRRFLEPLAPAQQSKFIAELTSRLEDAYATHGPLTFNFRRLFLSARVAPI